jgi:hypothetical protein
MRPGFGSFGDFRGNIVKRWIVRGLQGYLLYVLVMVVVSILAAYKGRIVDAETKEPMEGVVVFMEWDYLQFNIMPHYTAFAGAVETLTDKDGKFSLPWWWSLIPGGRLRKETM